MNMKYVELKLRSRNIAAGPFAQFLVAKLRSLGFFFEANADGSYYANTGSVEFSVATLDELAALLAGFNDVHLQVTPEYNFIATICDGVD